MITSLILATALVSCPRQAVVAQSYVQQYAAVQQYAVAPQVLYFVGAPLRVQSLVEHAQRTDPAYAEFLEFKAFKAGKHASQQPQAMTANGEMLPPPNPEPVSLVQQHCAKCHGTATPEAGYFIDGQPGMRPTDVLAALRAISNDKMPKDHKLTREQKNLLLKELLDLEQTQTQENEQ